MTIEEVAPSQFSWEYEQSKDLTELTFVLKYRQSVAGKKLGLSYSQGARRLLTAISFDEDFTLDSFPPAFYTEEDRIKEFENLRQLLYRLSLVLLILSALSSVFIRRMHVHIASFFTLPALLSITFGLAPENFTDWSKWAFKDVLPLSLFGGFVIGEKGQRTEFL